MTIKAQTHPEPSESARVFGALLDEWLHPQWEEARHAGGGQPMHTTRRWLIGAREEWEQRFAEAQATDRLRRATERL